MPNPVPEGYQTVTPSLTFKDSEKAIEFYKKAFGATDVRVMKAPGGRGVMHATLRIGSSILMMGDEMPQCQSAQTLGGSPIGLFVYVPDVDAAFAKAVAAGAKPTMPVTDMFWGDRCGNLMDPFGYSWMIGTHKVDLTEAQIQQGAQEFFARMVQKS